MSRESEPLLRSSSLGYLSRQESSSLLRESKEACVKAKAAQKASNDPVEAVLDHLRYKRRLAKAAQVAATSPLERAEAAEMLASIQDALNRTYEVQRIMRRL